MMKLISAVLALALVTGSTLAADLPSRKGPPPVYAPQFAPMPPLWTGFYVGANLGGGLTNNTGNNNNAWWWGVTGTSSPFFPVLPVGGPATFAGSGWNNNGSNSSGGVVGGGQAGFNAQFTPVFVAGLETDFQGTSIGSGGSWGWGNNVGARLNWFGTVRGRLGWLPMQNLLAYGTGGFAYGELQGKGGWLGLTNWNSVGTGWTAGGGLEWMFVPRWSAKIEYLYTDLGNFSNNNGGFGWANNAQYRFSTIRAGVNWHFNLFAPPPPAIVAKY
jgi:outer membrane immunogenic protein